jgi:hypothetical protein
MQLLSYNRAEKFTADRTNRSTDAAARLFLGRRRGRGGRQNFLLPSFTADDNRITLGRLESLYSRSVIAFVGGAIDANTTGRFAARSTQRARRRDFDSRRVNSPPVI